MEHLTEEELDQELKELRKLDKKRLPFLSKFFKDAVERPPSSILFSPVSDYPRLLSAPQYLTWLESDTVCPTLKAWKALVVDNMNMRMQLMNGFTTDEQTASDTIDTFRCLCYHQRGKEKPSETDAWDATAFYAAKLVKDNGHEGSPIHGMEKKKEVDWCYVVMIRRLIVVCTDMLRRTNGCFEKLLGGPSVEQMGKNDFKCNMLRIDNRPISKPSEMDGLHGYNRLHRDYPWFKHIGREGSGHKK